MRRLGGGAGRRRGGDAPLNPAADAETQADAVPAGVVRSHAPGRLRDTPWAHYGACARSSLTAPVHRGDTQARTEAEADALHSPRAAMERREARHRASDALPITGSVARRSIPSFIPEGLLTHGAARAPREAGGGALAEGRDKLGLTK